MPAAKVQGLDIRKIIFDNFNDTDVRFSNDDILQYLNSQEKYMRMDLDVLDFEDVLLDMESSGLLRAIAQNFNTRYYRIWSPLAEIKCKDCGFSSYFASESEETKLCPNCKHVL